MVNKLAFETTSNSEFPVCHCMLGVACCLPALLLMSCSSYCCCWHVWLAATYHCSTAELCCHCWLWFLSQLLCVALAAGSCVICLPILFCASMDDGCVHYFLCSCLSCCWSDLGVYLYVWAHRGLFLAGSAGCFDCAIYARDAFIATTNNHALIAATRACLVNSCIHAACLEVLATLPASICFFLVTDKTAPACAYRARVV